ncbi:MAG: tRNA pseudouridine(55) synthase TruB [Halanaerobiaceae bacterium]
MSDVHGIVNINKPSGMTSFQVVSAVKKILDCSKAGHTGTLDPAATGVLPICLGKGTKIIPFIKDELKGYTAEIILGITTDTLDSEGEILSKNEDWQDLTYEDIKDIVNQYKGIIEQLPPMYSAVHYRGKRLYKLARKGKEVEREPRQVEIKELDILKVDLPLIRLRVLCTRGTYIRTLADDIGRELNCGAFLSSLNRTRSGPFFLKDSIELDKLKHSRKKSILTIVYPLDYPKFYIKEKYLKKAKNGASLVPDDFIPEYVDRLMQMKAGKIIMVYYQKLFISISKIIYDDKNEVKIKPLRVFNLIV